MALLKLITLTGPDQPGLTAAIAQVLADHEANVLDINQAVIHKAMLLGLLIQVMDQDHLQQLLPEIHQQAEKFEVKVEIREITQAAYADWVNHQEQPRHILTLLTRQLCAQRLAQVAHIIHRQGLNIDIITRLSGRIPLDLESDSSRACVEFTLSGTPEDNEKMQADFVELSRSLNIDLAWQVDDAFRRTRRLVAFDMDSTLIQAEVIDELGKEAGVGEQIAKITEGAMRGEYDFDESLKRRVGLLEGLPETALETVAQRLELTEGAARLMRNLKRLGYKTAILSGGFTYFGHFLQRRLGFDYVIANQLDIQDGKLTGRVTGEIINGQRKAEKLAWIAQQEGIDLKQVIAAGDGANDLPMLAAAGLGIAFHAKPIVQETAEYRISELGLDGILYLIGVRDRDTPSEQ